MREQNNTAQSKKGKGSAEQNKTVQNSIMHQNIAQHNTTRTAQNNTEQNRKGQYSVEQCIKTQHSTVQNNVEQQNKTHGKKSIEQHSTVQHSKKRQLARQTTLQGSRRGCHGRKIGTGTTGVDTVLNMSYIFFTLGTSHFEMSSLNTAAEGDICTEKIRLMSITPDTSQSPIGPCMWTVGTTAFRRYF